MADSKPIEFRKADKGMAAKRYKDLVKELNHEK
jgi:hypothetical protein